MTVSTRLGLLLLLLIAASLAAPHRSATSSSSEVKAHRYYIQGYQHGKVAAMTAKDFQPSSETGLLPKEFSCEYIRGYGDGYQLVNR